MYHLFLSFRHAVYIYVGWLNVPQQETSLSVWSIWCRIWRSYRKNHKHTGNRLIHSVLGLLFHLNIVFNSDTWLCFIFNVLLMELNIRIVEPLGHHLEGNTALAVHESHTIKCLSRKARILKANTYVLLWLFDLNLQCVGR